MTELAHNLITGNLDDLSHTSKVVIPEKEREPNGPDTAMRPGIILGKSCRCALVFPGDTLNVVSPVGPITGASMTPKNPAIRRRRHLSIRHVRIRFLLAYIELAEAQKFFNMGATVTGIEVKVADVFRASDVARSIEQHLASPSGRATGCR